MYWKNSNVKHGGKNYSNKPHFLCLTWLWVTLDVYQTFSLIMVFLPLTLQKFFSEPLGKKAIFGIFQKLVKQTTKKTRIFALFAFYYVKPHWSFHRKFVFCHFLVDFLFVGTWKRRLFGAAHLLSKPQKKIFQKVKNWAFSYKSQVLKIWQNRVKQRKWVGLFAKKRQKWLKIVCVFFATMCNMPFLTIC